jgi:CRP-like cAMP-binding protein
MHLDQERLRIELRHLNWARQLDEEVINEIAAAAEVTEFQSGQVIVELDSEIKRVYFVVSGRLEGVLFDRLGKQVHCDTFQRGSVVGLFSILLPDRSRLRIEAAEPTTVIQLTLEELLRLTANYRE